MKSAAFAHARREASDVMTQTAAFASTFYSLICLRKLMTKELYVSLCDEIK